MRKMLSYHGNMLWTVSSMTRAGGVDEHSQADIRVWDEQEWMDCEIIWMGSYVGLMITYSDGWRTGYTWRGTDSADVDIMIGSAILQGITWGIYHDEVINGLGHQIDADVLDNLIFDSTDYDDYLRICDQSEVNGSVIPELELINWAMTRNTIDLPAMWTGWQYKDGHKVIWQY